MIWKVTYSLSSLPHNLLTNISLTLLGNLLGLAGVSGGLAVTLGMLQPHPDLLAQMLGCLLIGGSVGSYAASRIEVTSLPQMVAMPTISNSVDVKLPAFLVL